MPLTRYSIMFIIFSTIVALLALWHFQKDSINNMADEAVDWLQDKVLGWIPAPPTNKIDTHHHCVPSFYRDGLASPISLVWLFEKKTFD